MLVMALLACSSDQPRARVVQRDPERSAVAEAGVLLTTFLVDGPSYALLIDGHGEIRWSREGGDRERVVRVEAARDDTVLIGFNDPDDDAGTGSIVRQTLAGEILSETPAPTFHHDLVELDDGRLAFLGHAFAEVDVPGHGVIPVATDTIRVAPEGGESEVVFDFLEDYVVAPYWTCPHMERDLHVEGHHDWSHTNALIATADGWLLMPRYLDALVALDPSFRVRWQLGGEGATLTTEAPLFQHAHTSWAEGDRILVFDNGWNHGGLPPARVVEVAVDEVRGTAEVVWSYEEPEGRGTTFLGDARRLPNGNVLIAWGGLDRVTEVTPDGEVVWELDLEMSVGRVELWERPLPGG